MTKNPQRLVDYLQHILTAIEKIQRYTETDKDDFVGSDLVQDAVIRNLEIVGEASRNIDRDFPEFVAAHPELPLMFAYEMRNVLSHSYFNVDLEIVWNTISSDLPKMKKQIETIITQN
jgi:uncharacterized protein with HEPN domain